MKDEHKGILSAESQPLSQDQDEDDLERIFQRAVSEIDTLPLCPPKRRFRVCWSDVLSSTLVSVMLLGSFAGVIWSALTYPVITVGVLPATKTMTITVPLTIPTERLAPRTLTETLSAATIGKGFQAAQAARGMLTFYNGEFTSQVIAAGTTFPTTSGISVVTEASVTLPAANPPSLGMATVAAHATNTGPQGNIPAYALNAPCCHAAIKVVNLHPFTGGQTDRRFPVVAQQDVDHLTQHLQAILTERMPAAFPVGAGEAVVPFTCTFVATPNPPVGTEASSVTVTAQQTCAGLRYQVTDLKRAATQAFRVETQPSKSYDLRGLEQVTPTSVVPFTATITGTWVFHLDTGYERFLAEQIAGDSPAQARAYLLQTGVIAAVSLDQPLPKAPDYIRFTILKGVGDVPAPSASQERGHVAV